MSDSKPETLRVHTPAGRQQARCPTDRWIKKNTCAPRVPVGNGSADLRLSEPHFAVHLKLNRATQKQTGVRVALTHGTVNATNDDDVDAREEDAHTRGKNSWG